MRKEIKDPVLAKYIQQESVRQEEHLELIASENYASKEIMNITGSILTNKYAEGYPGKRYYGGCEFVDKIENIAIERAKKLFNCEYANVQPHSGSQANAAIFHSMLNPGDKVLGMSLNDGGHLTHGSQVNFSGKTYNFKHYGVNKDGFIDYDNVREIAKDFQPKMIIAGFSAYSRTIDWAKFKTIADEVSALFLVDMAHISGLVAADLIDSPIKYADFVSSTTHKTLRGPRSGIILSNNSKYFKKLNSGIFPGIQGGPLVHVIAAKAQCFLEAMQPEFVEYQKQVLTNAKVMAKTLQELGLRIVSDGTDNHLLMVDLSESGITGKEAEALLEKANITTNKNQIPNDTKSPFITSGIRIGCAAITTRGMKEKEVIKISKWISQIISKPQDENLLSNIRKEVSILCNNFPVYR